ncbi:MAG: carbon monoxide dehydrogenase [Betaproteobacteria bacterium]|nr:carbon monoxide dehydrogenase [Betaproteobacteria bacterium]
MLPARFELHRPECVADALALLSDLGEDATFYAGGTELLVAMKARVLRFGHVVDIKRIEALRGIALREDGTLVIGALATHHQLANHPLVLERFSAYAALSADVANIRVRVAGTLGGNLCFAEPHADPPALLCALDARVVLCGPEGERVVPMAEFILGEFTTARKDRELLVRVEIPRMADGAQAAYRAFGHLERPAVGVAALRAANGRWRFWVGAISGHPTLLECAPEEVADAAAGIDADDDLHGSAEYKRHLVGVLARRAANACQR